MPTALIILLWNLNSAKFYVLEENKMILEYLAFNEKNVFILKI